MMNKIFNSSLIVIYQTLKVIRGAFSPLPCWVGSVILKCSSLVGIWSVKCCQKCEERQEWDDWHEKCWEGTGHAILILYKQILPPSTNTDKCAKNSSSMFHFNDHSQQKPIGKQLKLYNWLTNYYFLCCHAPAPSLCDSEFCTKLQIN